MKNYKNPFTFFILCFLLFFLGINAIMGGLLLMLAPDGSLMGMTLDWLQNAPFKNYFIPGFLLFSVLGVFTLFTLVGLVFNVKLRHLNFLNIYPDRFWAWTYSLYIGLIAIIWITVQLIMTQYFWIQPVIIFNGVLIIMCVMDPKIMKKYEIH